MADSLRRERLPVRYRVEDDRVVVLAVKHQREAGYA